MAIRAAPENHAIVCCPFGRTMKAAKRGLREEPGVAADLKDGLREAVLTSGG